MAESMLIQLHEFARLLYARDVSILGRLEVGSWRNVRTDYLDEANFYITKTPDEWPCHILISIGQHNLYHPDCDGE